MAAIGLRTRARSRLIPNAEPNVIPFIDVLLVLLIIFMVTAPKPTTDLRVDLPRPGHQAAAALPPTVIAISRSGGQAHYTIGGEEIRRDQLAQEAMARMLAADPILTPEDVLIDGRLFVRADLDVAYQDVVTVVDVLQHAQFQKVAIAAQNAE